MTEQEREERDDRLLKTLARLRVMVFEHVVQLCFKGVESTAHTVLTRYARPDKTREAYLQYFNRACDEKPIDGLKFIALTEEGCGKAGMDGKRIKSRSWGFGSALDSHLSSSIFFVE